MTSKMSQNLIKTTLETKSSKHVEPVLNLIPLDLQETCFRIFLPPTAHCHRCDSSPPRTELNPSLRQQATEGPSASAAPNYEFMQRRPTQDVSKSCTSHVGPSGSHPENAPGWTTHQFGAGHANNPIGMDSSSRSNSVEAVSQQAPLRIGTCWG